MFGDLLGKSDELGKNMQENLKTKEVSVNREGIVITGNAARQVTSIDIDAKYFQNDEKEMLEDMLTVLMNSFIEEVSVIEAEESQKMIKSIMPPGFGL